MIPPNIERTRVEQVIARIESEGIPAQRTSRFWALEQGGKLYPPNSSSASPPRSRLDAHSLPRSSPPEAPTRWGHPDSPSGQNSEGRLSHRHRHGGLACRGFSPSRDRFPAWPGLVSPLAGPVSPLARPVSPLAGVGSARWWWKILRPPRGETLAGKDVSRAEQAQRPSAPFALTPRTRVLQGRLRGRRRGSAMESTLTARYMG